VAENLTQLIVTHLANISTFAAKGRNPRHGIASGSTGHFKARAHLGVKTVGGFGVDQSHGVLYKVQTAKVFFLAVRKNVDNGIADSDDVEFGVTH
jgi:hypothetical protein